MTELRSGLPIILFETASAFDQWLVEQNDDAPGAWLRFAKKGAPYTSTSKAEAIDNALCHGWIDGQLDKYDEASWLIRFTPRKARSKWSQVNRSRAEELIAAGRMMPRGLTEVEKAQADGRWEAAYAPASTIEVPADLREALDRNPRAAKFFATLRGANRYAIIYRIGAVQRTETRARKIASSLQCSRAVKQFMVECEGTHRLQSVRRWHGRKCVEFLQVADFLFHVLRTRDPKDSREF